MSKDARYPTTLFFNNRKLWVSDAKAASEISSDCSQPIDETNVPGGTITDLTALENHIRLNYKGIHLAWKEDAVPISSSSIVNPIVDPEYDEASYSKLKGLAPDDMAGVVLLAFQREVQSALDRKAAVGRVLISLKNKVDNMLRVLPQKVDTRVSTLPQDLVELAKKITVNDAITELQRRTHGVTVLSTFHAPIFFSEYEGLSLYYSSSKDYVLEINGFTMTISQHGYVVSVDDGFDAELEKIKVRIFRFDEKAARAVTTLSRVLEGKLSGSYYNIWYDETNQLGQAKYPGFNDFQRRVASLFKTRLAGVVSNEGGIQVPCDKDWHHHSVPHLAFYMLYKDTLNGSTAVLNGIENFIDATCAVKADLFSTSIRELINLRKDIENSRILPFILRPQKCVAYLKSAVAIMNSFGMSCTGVRNLRVSETEVVKLVFPKFSENSARLKSGRTFRNKEPRSSLFKQYPICPGGPAVVLGEATADKAVNILATLASVAGTDVLSGCSQFLYSGVTNYDRMLEIICEKWIAAHPDVDTKVALSAMTLLDKVHSSPPRWKIEYKEHKFALRTADNLNGQFVCTDLLKYLNSMDVSKGRKDFIFSDANVLGTDDDSYLTKNEFAVQAIDLGSDSLEDWLSGRSTKWTPSAMATAKYCLKAASKFRAGVLKLHIFDLDPIFFSELGHQLDVIFGVDSFLWKNGRGHNNEYFFYFFPKVRTTPLYLASPFYIPVLLSAVAMSEFSRHVVFYAPHRLYGMEKFGEKGYLENSPNFPILVPSFHSRSFETIKIGAKEFLGIKGLRTGLKSLVSGIKIEKPDDEEFDVRAFSSIPEAVIKPVNEVDSSEIPLVLKDKGPQKVLSIKQEQAHDPLKLMSGGKSSRLALSVDELDVGPASTVEESEDIPVVEEEEQEDAEYSYQPEKDEESLRKERKQVVFDDTD